MPQKPRLIQLPLVGKVFLCVLAIVYLGYLVGLVNSLSPSSRSTSPIVEHQLTNLDDSLSHWTVTAMRNADDVDELNVNASDQTTFNLQQASIDNSKTAGQQPGTPPSNGDSSFPITTVGKVFFSDQDGRDYVCS